ATANGDDDPATVTGRYEIDRTLDGAKIPRAVSRHCQGIGSGAWSSGFGRDDPCVCVGNSCEWRPTSVGNHARFDSDEVSPIVSKLLVQIDGGCISGNDNR